MKEATNVSEVHSFLDIVNQLGKFIPGLAEKVKPLRELLSQKKTTKKTAEFGAVHNKPHSIS